MACPDRSKITSRFLTATQQERALEAARHAEKIHCEFTHQLTIRWEHADGGGSVQERHQRLLICARHWLKRQGVPLVCLWTVEPDTHGKGCHVHTLIHLPRHLARGFADMLPIWTNTEPLDPKAVRKAKAKYRQKYPKNSVAWCGYPDELESPVCHLQRRYDNSPRLVRYLLKSELSQPRHQGKVVGKRIGYSNAIGPAHWARSEAAGQPATV